MRNITSMALTLGISTSGLILAGPASAVTVTACAGQTFTADGTCTIEAGETVPWTIGSYSGTWQNNTGVQQTANVFVGFSGANGPSSVAVVFGIGGITADVPGNDPVSFTAVAAVDTGDQTPPSIYQSVGVPSKGSCADVNDTGLDYGTGVKGGWARSWEAWVNPTVNAAGERLGGWACSRTLVYNTSAAAWEVKP